MITSLYVILTVVVVSLWVGQRPDCNDLGSDNEKADYFRTSGEDGGEGRSQTYLVAGIQRGSIHISINN